MFHSRPTELSWFEKCVQGQVPGHTSTKGAQYYKDFHLPSLRKAVIISMPNDFKHPFLSFSVVRFQPLDVFCGCFLFYLGEGWGGIECLRSDKGVSKSMEGQNTAVACLTFTRMLSHWATAERGWHWNTLIDCESSCACEKAWRRETLLTEHDIVLL